MQESLISKYQLEMVSPACTPGAQWWSALITFDGDISAVLPYLNSELDDCEYYPGGHVLIWDNEGKRLAFRRDKIEIAPVENREEAGKVCREALELLEDIWRRRDRITPDVTGKLPPPSVLEVLKLLPGTNCKQCGCLTCLAYAAALIQGQARLSECSAISDESMKTLINILGQGVA